MYWAVVDGEAEVTEREFIRLVWSPSGVSVRAANVLSKATAHYSAVEILCNPQILKGLKGCGTSSLKEIELWSQATLTKINAAILSDNSLSDEHKTALIELMRVAYVTLTAESNLTKK